MDSLYGTPVTGLKAASFQMDVIANNIANVNTTGYQTVEASLTDLPLQAQVGNQNNGDVVPASTQVGMGSRPAETRRTTDQGLPQVSGNTNDLIVDGPGYFAITQHGGQLGYVKQMTLTVQPDGKLSTSDGLNVVPPMAVPKGTSHVSVDQTGKVSAQSTNGTAKVLGTLQQSIFAAPASLAEQSGVYTETLNSGRPQAVNTVLASDVMSGYQLHSTVDLATEMADMIDTQRMFQANSKALQTLDALVNNIVSVQPR